ncbi:MAG: flagellar FlbD family protein [Spirochaetes bacterium]|nr:flagellar FlbD family protein [Spirochaetota bacterium]
MILLHRLNNSEFYLNCNQIEYLEQTPDTVIRLLNEKTYIVKESADEIISKIIDYNSKIIGKKLS